MVLPQLLAELICNGLFLALFGGPGTSSKPPTKISNPAQKQTKKTTPVQRQSNQLINCAVQGCNALTFRTTEYCWRHKDDPQLVSELGSEQEPNWGEDSSGG